MILLIKNCNMKLEIKFIKTRQFGRCLVLGSHLYNPEREIIEHLKTMYFVGYFLIVISYKFKFKEVFINQSNLNNHGKN